jgi:geranylgeranyl diphosphate synthase type II
LGDEQLIGKPVLSDVRNEKTTYVKLYGLDKAKADVIKYSEEAKELLYTLNNENRNEGIEFAGELIELLVNRNK